MPTQFPYSVQILGAQAASISTEIQALQTQIQTIQTQLKQLQPQIDALAQTQADLVGALAMINPGP